MSRVICGIALLLLISCSMFEEDVIYVCGTGYLYKDDMEFVCPFTLQTRTSGRGWRDRDSANLMAYDVGEYYPLSMRYSDIMYRVLMRVPKEYFTEEQYAVSMYAVNKAHKPLGESREFTFYKIAESADSIEYVSRRDRDGEYLFFGQREMPSHDWYHVLSVGRESKNFRLIGEIAK